MITVSLLTLVWLTPEHLRASEALRGNAPEYWRSRSIGRPKNFQALMSEMRPAESLFSVNSSDMGKKVAVVQSNYIPWKGYFDLINLADEFILYDDMQYTRRDWRN